MASSNLSVASPAIEQRVEGMTAAGGGVRPRLPSILFVGGVDHHLRVPFLLALRASGFGILAAGTGGAEPFAAARIPYYRYSFERFVNPRADIVAISAIKRLVDDVRPDIVHSFDTKPNILVPLAVRDRRSLRVVRTINGLGWVYSSRSPLALALRPVLLFLHHKAGSLTDATIFQNAQDAAYFVKHGVVSPGSASVIPGSGIDIQGFDTAFTQESEESLRESLGLGGHPVVLTVTRLTKQKGIPTLLRAAARVHSSRPDVRFLLVGPRETESSMAVSRREIERYAPYVIATGARRDIPALLRIADVFAFPTEYREGVPRALLEAALAGLPIVATDMPGCTDVVSDQVIGLLVPPRSPDELARRIIGLLDNPDRARAMGRRASVLVRTGFGLDDVVARYAQLYRSLQPEFAKAARISLASGSGVAGSSTECVAWEQR
jgi:glycosyltransferase involved in cell wall biosynthesis